MYVYALEDTVHHMDDTITCLVVHVDDVGHSQHTGQCHLIWESCHCYPLSCSCCRVATKILLRFLEGSVKDLLQTGRAAKYQIYFVATFRVNNRPFYMAQCSFLVLVGLLDAGSWPSVVDGCYRFLTYNRSVTDPFT